jgi:hypothetical protein
MTARVFRLMPSAILARPTLVSNSRREIVNIHLLLGVWLVTQIGVGFLRNRILALAFYLKRCLPLSPERHILYT